MSAFVSTTAIRCNQPEQSGHCLLNEAAARRTGLDILRRTDDCRAAMKHANVNIKFETVVSGLFSQIETAA
jgi:hypothetical protein